MQDELLTIDEVKDILKVSRQMVYTLIKQQPHPLPIIHISKSSPRIKRSELEIWITEKGEIAR
jgi:predicted DNA-binding transcriptional regulator AlpA